MKAIKLLIACLFFASIGVQSQYFYLRPAVGAAVTTSASYYNELTVILGDDGAKEMIKGKKFGLGTGLPLGLAMGYALKNDYFAFELAVNYFYGFTRKTKDTYYEDVLNTKKQGQMLSLIPAVVFGYTIDKFRPYGRLGLIIGVMNSVRWQYDEKIESGMKDYAMNTVWTEKDYGGVAIGVQAAAGGAFVINEMFSLFGEFQVNGISFSPKKGKISKYEEDGVDKLGDLTKNQKEWTYVKELDNNDPSPPDEPCKMPRVNHKFSDVGFVIGLQIKFHKKDN